MMLALQIFLWVMGVIGFILAYALIGALVYRAVCAMLHNDPHTNNDSDKELVFGLTLAFWPLIWLVPVVGGCFWLVTKVAKI